MNRQKVVYKIHSQLNKHKINGNKNRRNKIINSPVQRLPFLLKAQKVDSKIEKYYLCYYEQSLEKIKRIITINYRDINSQEQEKQKHKSIDKHQQKYPVFTRYTFFVHLVNQQNSQYYIQNRQHYKSIKCGCQSACDFKIILMILRKLYKLEIKAREGGSHQ